VVTSELRARLLMSLIEEQMVRLYNNDIGPQLTDLLRRKVVLRKDISDEQRAVLAMRCAMQTFALAAGAVSHCRGSFGPLGRDQAPFFREVMEEIIDRMEAGAVEEMQSDPLADNRRPS
jgi:hypothetical protein